jgi:hypothetical protein
MLLENENVISFTPGSVKKGQVVSLGKVIVHDRVKVEKDVLPKYFNHSSFASLRRQLNYFKFVREGKGRQKGATYCNEEVIHLEDILRLRRRPISTGSTDEVIISQPVSDSSADENGSPADGNKRSAIASKKRSRQEKTAPNKSRKTMMTTTATTTLMEMATVLSSPKIVSPRSTPSASPATSPTSRTRITLDLTLPSVTSAFAVARTSKVMEYTFSPDRTKYEESVNDEDVVDAAEILVSMSSTSWACHA